MNVLSPGQVDTPDSQRLDKETRQMFESLIPRGKMGRPEEIATCRLPFIFAPGERRCIEVGGPIDVGGDRRR